MQILNFLIKNQILSWENPCQGVTENTRGILRAAFETDSEWDGMARTAVFQHGMDEPVMVPVTEETVLIPPEVIVAGELRVGLVGVGAEGNVQIPTRWMNKPIQIWPSTPTTGKGPESVTPELWQQALAVLGNLPDLNTENKSSIVAAINEVLQLAQAGGGGTGGGTNGREVELSVDNGYIVWRYVGDTKWRNLVALSDLTGPAGTSPTIAVETISGGHRVTITDVNGSKQIDILDGENGRGIASIDRTAGTGAPGTTDTYTITYTDNAAAQFTVYNGKDGEPGQPGTPGKNGDPGYTPQRGTDYWSPADQEQIVKDVLAALPTWNGGSY